MKNIFGNQEEIPYFIPKKVQLYLILAFLYPKRYSMEQLNKQLCTY